MIAYCDFETFSEQEIKFGSFRYAMDPSTEVLCLAYRFGKEGKTKLWRPGLPYMPTDLLQHIKDGGTIKAWNVTFEYAIFNYVCTRLYGWPKLSISQVECTQAEALCLSLPASLGMCAEALNTVDQKDKLGKSLITKLCKPRKPTKNLPHTRVTPEIDPEAFENLYKYCIKDVDTEVAIGNILPRELSEKEMKIFRLTLKINERGIPVNLKLVKAIMKAKAAYEERLNNEISFMTNGELDSTGSRPKSLEWLKRNGLLLAGYTKGDIQKALTKPGLSDDVRRFLNIRSELSRTPIKKYDFIMGCICPDGTIKNNIIYHKATTGRYAGAGFQIQNLPRASAKNTQESIDNFLNETWPDDANIYDEAINLIRNVLEAPANFKLVVSDFSSIENRVAAWLSGDYKTLGDFEAGIDQYIDAATAIYNVDYEKVTKDQRQLGKISVLACVFGGGHKTFRTVCQDQWGITISEEESKHIVDAYRAKYPKIKNMWYELYDASLNAVAEPGKVFVFKHLKFRYLGDFLYMRLPSGRMIAYYKPELRMVTTPWGAEKLALTHMGQNTYTRKWERLTVIPGRLTENAVQAVARDFLVESMLRVEESGYPLIACVHDENISLVKEEFGSIEEYDKIMEINPEWAIDCPIEAEGFEGKRYKK